MRIEAAQNRDNFLLLSISLSLSLSLAPSIIRKRHYENAASLIPDSGTLLIKCKTICFVFDKKKYRYKRARADLRGSRDSRKRIIGPSDISKNFWRAKKSFFVPKK